VAGGAPIFPELCGARLARDRIVNPSEAARRNPEIVFASWCGKKVRRATIRTRPGWDRVKAVLDDRIFEIKSSYILQPGPASLSEGVRQLHAVFARIHGIEIDAALTPQIQQ
jgi:iron complex transport system substrate-binding protein